MNQNRIKKLKWLGVVAVLLLLQASVYAAYYLPESSLWQGSRYYNKDNVYAYVEYAVYDSQAADYHNVLDGLKDGFPMHGSGQYIYAYQVFDLGTDLPPIATFELLGGNPTAAAGIGSLADAYSGVMPTNSGDSFVWTFENGILIVDKHSAFMVFSSNSGPIAGDFKLSTEYGDAPPINSEVPEPATMAILASGVFGLLTRKKSV
jgi:hypothetical protein